GIRTVSCMATLALRIRVSMSAMGSVIVMSPGPLPARLGHTRHLAGVHQLAQTDAAQAELPQDRVGPASTAAAGVGPHLELGLALGLDDERLFGHESVAAFSAGLVAVSAERESEGVEQGSTLRVVAGGRDNGDVHAAGGVDLVVVDFREDQLLVDTERVVASPVERFW